MTRSARCALLAVVALVPAGFVAAGFAPTQLFVGVAAAQEAGGGTGAMREKVYEKLSSAQRAAESKKFGEALQALQDVEKMKDLDPYEKAQLYTAFGYIAFLQEKFAESIAAYEKVLQQEKLPKALETSTLYTIAQLQFHVENYDGAITYLDRWLRTVANPGPEPFILLGQAYYQQGRFKEAVEPVEHAMWIAGDREQPVQESWYVLQRAIYHELHDDAKLLRVLEHLVSEYPRKEYWIHLAATYGETGEEGRQLATYQIAYQQGYLDRGPEIVLLSQLLLRAEVPYRAGVVLEKGLGSGLVEASAENYRLLSQAWALAHEDEKAIAALTKAASLSTDGELDARLAQSYANLEQWEKTVEAARTALRKGVHGADEVQIMLGTALFELQRFDDARAALRAAQQSPGSRDTASRWLTYIDSEEARLHALRSSPP